MDKPIDRNQLYVRVLSPREVLYQGEAKAVSSRNSQGKFDVLPQHANYITIIENEPIEVLKPDNKLTTFKVKQAILYTVENKVTIYTDPTIDRES